MEALPSSMRPYNSRLGGGNTGPHNHQREREREREREEGRKGGREREGWMKERGREGEITLQKHRGLKTEKDIGPDVKRGRGP
jgi:hypothetical protein